ncbi:MAG: hypothetical protein FD162_1342 [Rhodobacteraceae bacterium]|uniref:hypothetical protein n=1 Tax=Cypionkella sp. TaxID=2811411 RepID=UPI00132B4F8E|nr:hypothetical protein [Cypionkella sp.]KAF0174107.1 MAG: hypothetical protein FD162_1342 [Paracoccaceae bacterium]MDO8327321.1 hypothetical protein [Cypionkella sp.]
MQVVRKLDQEHFAPVGFGVRVMLVSQGAAEQRLRHSLAGLGGKVEDQQELFVGLEAVIDDPAGYGLCVIDCDAIGGLAMGRKAHALLADVALRVAVILISSECSVQEFPEQRGMPVVLRGTASAVSLRVGFEHALRERLAVRMI